MAQRGPADWAPLQCPLNNGEGAVQVWPDELASVSFESITNALVGEVPPLQVWHAFAVAFRRLGRQSEFEQILGIVQDNTEDIEKHIATDASMPLQEGKLLIANAATSTVLEQCETGLEPEALSANVTEAMKILQGADKIDSEFPLSNMNRAVGTLHLGHSLVEDAQKAMYQYERALTRFNKLLNDDSMGVPAMLGKAAIFYHRQRYPLARELYMKALRLNPHAGPELRVAIGLCSFQMGDLERARIAFRRALQLSEGTNVQALMGEALLIPRLDDVSLESRDGRRNRQQANRFVELADHFARHRDSMALNHLANILFFRWKPVTQEVTIIDEQTLGIAADAATFERRLKHGDPLRINNHMNAVFAPEGAADPNPDGATAVVKLRDPLPEDFLKEHGFSGNLGPGGSPSPKSLSLHLRELERAYKCAAYAHNLSKNPKVRAESLFHIGRIFHARGQLTKARQNYKYSFSRNPNLPLPYLGYAQVNIDSFLQDPKNNLRFLIDAYQILQTLEACAPKFPEALLLQAAILSHAPPEALEDLRLTPEGLQLRRVTLLEEVTRLQPNQPEGFLQLGQACSRLPGRAADALRCLEKGLDLGAPGNRKLYNNVAVLALAVGQLDKAEGYLRNGLAGHDGGSGYDLVEPANELLGTWASLGSVAAVEDECEVTLAGSPAAPLPTNGLLRVGSDLVTNIAAITSATTFSTRKRLVGLEANAEVHLLVPRVALTEDTRNLLLTLAHLHEAKGHGRAAKELYEILKAQFPGAHESSCRLALLALQRGEVDAAETIIAEAVEAFGADAPDVHLVRGYIHLSIESYRTAQQSFAVAEKATKNGHPYALCGSANLFYANLDDHERYAKNLGHAASQFKHVLKTDRGNISAANGLGLTLVEKRDFAGASEVFHRLRMVTVNPFADASINLGHLKLRAGDFAEAMSLYGGANVRHFRGLNVPLYTYVGLAQLLNKDRVGAVKSTQRALHLAPFNLNAWYNCAFAHEQHAERVLLNEDAYTVARLRRALHFLRFAVQVAAWLVPASSTFLGLDKSTLRGVFTYVSQLKSLKIDFPADRLVKRRVFRVEQMAQAKGVLDAEITKERERLAEVEERRRTEQEEEERLRLEQKTREEEGRKKEAEARKKVQEETRRKNEMLRERQKVWEVEEHARAEAKKRRGVQKAAAHPKLGDDLLEAVPGKRKSTRDDAAPEEVDEMDWGSANDSEGEQETKESKATPERNDGRVYNDENIFDTSPIRTGDASPEKKADEGLAEGGDDNPGPAAPEPEVSDEGEDDVFVSGGRKRKVADEKDAENEDDDPFADDSDNDAPEPKKRRLGLDYERDGSQDGEQDGDENGDEDGDGDGDQDGDAMEKEAEQEGEQEEESAEGPGATDAGETDVGETDAGEADTMDMVDPVSGGAEASGPAEGEVGEEAS